MFLCVLSKVILTMAFLVHCFAVVRKLQICFMHLALGFGVVPAALREGKLLFEREGAWEALRRLA